MNRVILLLLVGWWCMYGASCRGEQKPAWKNGEQAKVQIEEKSSDNLPAPSASGVKTVKNKKLKIEKVTDVPEKVLETLAYIEKNGEAPKGYVGGRTFQNRERRLPTETAAGERITYQEWDVNPKERGKNRGAERLITGSDNTAYFTQNHYKSFVKIESKQSKQAQKQ